MRTKQFFIMLLLDKVIVVSEHIRYRTEKFDKKYYERQLFSGSEHECNVALRRRNFGELCYV